MNAVTKGSRLNWLFFVIGLLVSSSVPLAWAACGAGCSDECKLHNRWCAFNGWKYSTPIAITGWCSESPDGGSAIENDTVTEEKWLFCIKDCKLDAMSTGAPFSRKLETNMVTKKTKCEVLGGH